MDGWISITLQSASNLLYIVNDQRISLPKAESNEFISDKARTRKWAALLVHIHWGKRLGVEQGLEASGKAGVCVQHCVGV